MDGVEGSEMDGVECGWCVDSGIKLHSTFNYVLCILLWVRLSPPAEGDGKFKAKQVLTT